MLKKKRLPLFIAIICCLEVIVYLWSVWTSTFDRSNFFSIEPAYILDKSARIAGRVSSAIFLILLVMVGYYGLKKIYADQSKKYSFLILLTLFSVNHLIHLMFVMLRFRIHGDSIILSGPIEIGGILHGIFTFACIVVIPIILWTYKLMNKFLYLVIILHLFNISTFIVKTFLGKIILPEHPAYHNQLGVFIITSACLYILYRVYLENKRQTSANR